MRDDYFYIPYFYSIHNAGDRWIELALKTRWNVRYRIERMTMEMHKRGWTRMSLREENGKIILRFER